MNEDPENDILILNSLSDESFANDLAFDLQSEGFSVWINYDNAPPDSLKKEIEHNLEVSRVLVLLMSSRLSTTEWASFENYSTIFRAESESDRHFIPILIDDVDIPVTLRHYNYIDLRVASGQGYEKLVELCLKFCRHDPEEEHAIEQRRPEKVIPAHTREIVKIKTARKGHIVATSALDNKVKLWDFQKRSLITSFTAHKDYVYGLAITPDGTTVVSGSDDNSVKVWKAGNEKPILILEGHKGWVRSAAISDDGKIVVSGSDDKTVRVWDGSTGTCVEILEGHRDLVRGLAISSDGHKIVSASDAGDVRVWDLSSRSLVSYDGAYSVREASFIGESKVLLRNKFDSFYVWDTYNNKAVEFEGSISEPLESAISLNHELIVYINDLQVYVHDLKKGKDVLILEGHTAPVVQAVITSDGSIAVSKSNDQTTRIWDMRTGKCLQILKMPEVSLIAASFNDEESLSLSGFISNKLAFWDIHRIRDSHHKLERDICYTNAKVLLVGETGVGKTGLARRLVENKFIGELSTDGVWASQLKLDHSTDELGNEREIWLWDFAGQSDYRLIHQLYMDETALAVLIFNPQHDNPFEGLGQWDSDIIRAARHPFKNCWLRDESIAAEQP